MVRNIKLIPSLRFAGAELPPTCHFAMERTEKLDFKVEILINLN